MGKNDGGTIASDEIKGVDAINLSSIIEVRMTIEVFSSGINSRALELVTGRYVAMAPFPDFITALAAYTAQTIGRCTRDVLDMV